ncbi:hypothetical protein IWW36_003452 [Coemansia brasiliensis]|uniref:Ankyrin n=1 Tax=Coemansia brasiliensis TaxID=2650707 RepID=A0A9W8I5E3_9FUNG|nr:hypothetical protein IWW36_003452 [Coemansia brasiliensis]
MAGTPCFASPDALCSPAYLLDMSDRNKHLGSRVGASSAPNLGLHCAVSRGDIGSICYALLGGQPIDCLCDGLQPIHIAAMQDDPAVIEILLQNGADVNARTMPSLSDKAADVPAQPDRKSVRKFHQRTLGSRSSFSFLKYSGVGPISAPIGFTTGLHSMQTAHSLSNDVAVDRICQSPSSVADLYREYHNATPLHLAVAHAHIACIEILLKNGAWTDAVDSYGNTPVSVAAVCGNADVAALVCQEQSGMKTIFADGSNTSAYQEANPTYCTMSSLSYCSEYRPSDAENRCLAQQLPSPNPSDRTLPALSPIITALPDGLSLRRRLSDEAVLSPEHLLTNETHLPPRRHTAGEADAYLHYGNSSISPAGSWIKVKHRDSSPIGMRSLAHSYSESRYSREENFATAPEKLPNEEFIIGNGLEHQIDHSAIPVIQPVAREVLEHPARRKPLLDSVYCGARQVARNVSTGSRRERSYTDSVIERAWRSYLEYGDEQARENAEQMAANDTASGVLRPLPESWMWQQAAIAVRYRRSQSLSSNSKQH